MAKHFSFDNAAFHFTRTDGPPGFTWKYLLVYVGLSLALMALQIGLQSVLFGSSEEMELMLASGNIPPDMIGGIILFYLAAFITGIIFWAVMEAAIMRRYVHDSGFGLRLGGDEFRLMVVGLAWFATSLGIYFVVALAGAGLILPVVSLAGNSPAIVGVWATLVILGLGFLWIYAAVRLCAASALTIRDKKIHFIDSWGATKGRFGGLLGAYLILALIFGIIAIVGIATFGAAMGWDFSDLDALAFSMQPKSIFGLTAVFTVLFVIFQGLGTFVWAGPAALAAKTDPRHGGRSDAADVFS